MTGLRVETAASAMGTESTASALGVRVVTIDRPEARNALTADMRRAFAAIMAAADADPDVDVVILTGTDPAFSAGVDLKERLGGDSPPPRVKPNPGEALRAMSTPVVCAVNGTCVTGALEMALSTTFVIASDRARFADTHGKVGLLPGWGLSALLPSAVGLRWARQMTITGGFVDAPTALRIGLVNEVVPHEELLPRAVELATAIAACDRNAVRASLALYAKGQGVTFDEGLRLEQVALDAFRVDSASARDRFTAQTGGASGTAAT